MYENLSRGGVEAFDRADRFLKKAIDNMDEIIGYKANLSDTLGAAISEGSESLPMHSNTKDYDDTFAEDDPLSWNVDPSKIDDISSDRD